MTSQAERYLDAETVKRLLGGESAIPKAGDLVAGKYRILGAIGEGGVGTILEAHHELLDKDVALKLIALESAPNASSSALAERFLIEARAAAKVESPHVARVMDVGKLDNGAPFLPLLVTTAMARSDESQAEAYTRECRKEDERNPLAMLSMLTFRGGVAPSGIYADCVRRLGREPPGENLKGKTVELLKKPVEVGKGLTQKLKDKFKRGEK